MTPAMAADLTERLVPSTPQHLGVDTRWLRGYSTDPKVGLNRAEGHKDYISCPTRRQPSRIHTANVPDLTVLMNHDEASPGPDTEQAHLPV